MKQNKKTVMIIGCIITICTFIAAVLIGWNHMVKITKGPKNEKEIGYYQWNHDQMDSFLDITTFTYHGDRYETADGGGDGAMSFGYLEASMKVRKPAFWLKETMNQTDKKIVKICIIRFQLLSVFYFPKYRLHHGFITWIKKDHITATV